MFYATKFNPFYVGPCPPGPMISRPFRRMGISACIPFAGRLGSCCGSCGPCGGSCAPCGGSCGPCGPCGGGCCTTAPCGW